MRDSLDRKVVKGISWSAVETFSFYFIKFVIGIIMARLLTPSDFGILGIILVFISISDTLVDAGFGQAYIHKEHVTNTDADTVFICNFAISTCIYVMLYCIAPFLAECYHYPSLTVLIRVSSIVIIIHSFTVIQNAIVRREFLFRKRAVIYTTSAVISGVIGIACAYMKMGIWSLVIQQIIQKSLICLILYFELDWHFTFIFSRKVAKEMFDYGFWVFLSNSIATAFANIYKFSIGKMFPAAELGYYERSRQFSSMLGDTITGILIKVAFPAYSRVQGDQYELKRLTCQFVKYSAMLIFPMLAILYVISEPLVILLLTEKWLTAAEYLKLMCLVGLFSPFYCFVGPLLQATSNVKLITVLVFILGLLRILNVVCLSKYGVSAIIVGEAFCLILYLIISSVYSRSVLGFYYMEVIKTVWKTIVITGVIWGLGIIVTKLGSSMNIYGQLALPSSLMVLLYVALMGYFEKGDIVSLYLQFKKNRSK